MNILQRVCSAGRNRRIDHPHFHSLAGKSVVYVAMVKLLLMMNQMLHYLVSGLIFTPPLWVRYHRCSSAADLTQQPDVEQWHQESEISEKTR